MTWCAQHNCKDSECWKLHYDGVPPLPLTWREVAAVVAVIVVLFAGLWIGVKP